MAMFIIVPPDARDTGGDMALTPKQAYDLVFYKHKKETGVVGTVVIMLMTAILFANVAATTQVGSIIWGVPVDAEDVEVNSFHFDNLQGSVDENSRTSRDVNLTQENMTGVSFTLKFTDEEVTGRFQTNLPDNLGIEIMSPQGEIRKSSVDSTPQKVVSFDIQPENGQIPSLNGTGIWGVTVLGGTMGDVETRGPGGIIRIPVITEDSSNSYEVEIHGVYLTLGSGDQ